jgi:kynurenine formamidase
MRFRFYAAAGAALLLMGPLGCRAQEKQAANMPMKVLEGVTSGKTKVVDLTYAIRAGLPAWPGDTRTFEATVIGEPQRDGYFSRSFWMLEHYGTHMDAPAHFPPGKDTVDEIPASKLVGPAVVIDVTAEAAKNPDYRLTTARIEEWERRHGTIPRGAIVLLRTGWAARWPDEARYRNEDAKGVMHTPGYSVEAAKLLIQRGVNGLGIDTLSIDYGESKTYEVHRTALPAGLYQLENLANLDALPATGAWIVAAPIKLEGGSGGPCRVLAFLPE